MIALYKNDEEEQTTAIGDQLVHKMDAFMREIMEEFKDYKKRDIENLCHLCVTEACLFAILKVKMQPPPKSTFYLHKDGFQDCEYLEVDKYGAVWYHDKNEKGRSDVSKSLCEQRVAEGMYILFNPEETK